MLKNYKIILGIAFFNVLIMSGCYSWASLKKSENNKDLIWAYQLNSRTFQLDSSQVKYKSVAFILFSGINCSSCVDNAVYGLSEITDTDRKKIIIATQVDDVYDRAKTLAANIRFNGSHKQREMLKLQGSIYFIPISVIDIGQLNQRKFPVLFFYENEWKSIDFEKEMNISQQLNKLINYD